MTLDDFLKSITASKPPAGLTLAVSGLWWDAKGDWTRAHESAQQDEGIEGSWVHAYLHRKEGDQDNAAYWYGRAGKPVCRQSLEVEWLGIDDRSAAIEENRSRDRCRCRPFENVAFGQHTLGTQRSGPRYKMTIGL